MPDSPYTFRFRPDALLAQVVELLAPHAESRGVELTTHLPTEFAHARLGDPLLVQQLLTLLTLRGLEQRPGMPLLLALQPEFDGKTRFSVSGEASESELQAATERCSDDLELRSAQQLLRRVGSRLVCRQLPDLGTCLCFSLSLPPVLDDTETAENASAPDGASCLPKRMPGIDIETALARLSQSPELYLKLLATFAEDFATAPQRIRDQIAAEERKQAEHLSHSLKGVASNLNLPHCWEAATDLNQALRIENVPVEAYISALEGALEEALDSIRQLLTQHAPAEDARVSLPALDPEQQIAELRTMLHRGEHTAMQRVDLLPLLLAGRASRSQISDLQNQIRRFAYDLALRDLEALFPPSDKASVIAEEKETHRETMLIVDDMPLNITLLARLFEDNYRILVANSGERAVELAKRELPDILLLDIVLPGMDGYDVCRILRDQDELRRMPIIFVTAMVDLVNEERGLSVGASDYITKPFHPPIVRARIRTHLELKRMSDQLARLAAFDALTGLPNRRSFDQSFAREWKHAIRQDSTLGLLLMDVDQFKRYNDHYGHRAGDDCLAQVARAIESALQREDDFVARYGGEEFVALLPGVDREQLEQIAERIRVSVLEEGIPHVESDASPHVTLSIGAGLVHPHLEALSERFVEHTDQLLYAAKNGGRNRVVVSSELIRDC